MKSLTTGFALALFVSTLTFASPGNDGCIGNCDGGSTSGAPQTQTTTVTVKPVIDVNARSRSEAYSASNSTSQSSVVSTPSLTSDNRSTASTGGNTVNLTTGGVSVNTAYPNKQRIYNVPNVNMGAVYPTAPCMGSSHIGGSGVGFGIGIGTSWTDDECGIRETSRSFSGIGLKDDAVSILCSSKYAKEAPTCKAQTTSNTSIQE